MKIAKFTVRRKDIDSLIHSLIALRNMADKPLQKERFVACNFLENRAKNIFFKIFKRDASMRVVIQIDRNLK